MSAEKILSFTHIHSNGDVQIPFVFEPSDSIRSIPPNRDLIFKCRNEASAYIVGNNRDLPTFADCGMHELTYLKEHYEKVMRQPGYRYRGKAEEIVKELSNRIDSLRA